MESLRQLFINIGTIDRRWIFFIVGLSVLIPLLSPTNHCAIFLNLLKFFG